MRRPLATLLALVALAALPAVAAADLGPHQTVEGTLRTWHGDTFTKPVDVGVGIDTGVAGVVRVDAAPETVGHLAGRRVRAVGTRQNGTLALSGSLQPLGPTALAAVTGTRTVAVLLFNFSNDTRQPWTTSYVRGVVFDNADSVNAYYQSVSYGQLRLEGDAFGWFTIDAPNTGCQWYDWATQARAKALAAGVPLASYTYTLYAFPQVSGCGWAGLGYLPGTASWTNGSMSLYVLSHELGHNFGVHHASTLSCTAGGVRVPLGGSCTASEYGDPFTVMGSGWKRHHANWHRAQLGWLPDVSTVTAGGIYSLAPAEVDGPTPKLLRVARGNGTYLNLEFRQPTALFDDFAATDPAVTGVSVRVAPELSNLVQSQLVDGNPATTSFADAPLGTGQSLVDPVSGVTVTAVSVSPAGAWVSVQFGSDSQPPSAPGSLAALPQSPTSIRLSWSPSSDDRGVAGYRVFRGGAQVATTTALAYTDSGLTPFTSYAYEVRAFDAAGNVSAPASAGATTQAVDTEAPSAPGTLTAVAKSRRANLAWGPATDNVGVVAYRVLRNGVQVAQTAGKSYRDGPGRGTFTYTVVAVDAAGNAGPASNAVTVRT